MNFSSGGPSAPWLPAKLEQAELSMVLRTWLASRKFSLLNIESCVRVFRTVFPKYRSYFSNVDDSLAGASISAEYIFNVNDV